MQAWLRDVLCVSMMSDYRWDDGSPVEHALLLDVAEFSREAAARYGRDPLAGLDDIGLILEIDGSAVSYEITPRNASVFAHTGGDGVHFALLHRGGRPTAASPVVMTVPFAFENANHVVGENLFDFLRLGSRDGFFSLEGLAYEDRRQEVLLILEGKRDSNKWPEKAELLRLFVERFSLKPWDEVQERLSALQARFYPELDVPGTA